MTTEEIRRVAESIDDELFAAIDDHRVLRVMPILQHFAEKVRDEERASHHALGRWPDCSGCVEHYRQSDDGAYENAGLSEHIALAEKLAEAVEAYRDIDPGIIAGEPEWDEIHGRIEDALRAFRTFRADSEDPSK